MLHISTLPFLAPRKKVVSKEFILPEVCHLEQWTIPAGVKIKLITTRDMGIVVLPEGTRDITGYKMHKRFFQY